MRFAVLMLLVAGCAQPKTASKPAESSCREQNFEGSQFTVCNNRGAELRLFAAGGSETPLRSFSALMPKLETDRVAFAMNAGMFDQQGRPIGYAVAEGKQLKALNLRAGPGNFHLQPNGVFLVDAAGKPSIHSSEAIPSFRPSPQLATQSGPMLVIHGDLHPKLQADGQSRFIRNGVGVRGGEAIFVISETPVSLGKFARFFRDQLETPDALYFDGSVSSLWDPANGRQDSHSELGPIIVAFKRAESKPDREGRATP